MERTSPRHLGLVCPEYPPAPHGGIGSFAQDLAECLLEAGWRLTVLAPLRSPYPQDDSGDAPKKPRIRCMAPFRFSRPWSWITIGERWRFKRFVQRCHREDPFAILECQDYDGWLPWGSGLSVPTIMRLHGSNLLYDHELKRRGIPLIHRLEKQTLIKAHSWIGVSKFAFQRSLERCGLTQHPGTVIYNAVDTDLFSPAPQDETEPGLIVFVNSLNKRKGLDTLLRAMPIVLNSAPHARLAIIGGQLTPGTELHTIYGRLAPEVRARIEFPGRLDRRTGVVAWLRRAQVCCYPSRVETFGLAPVEAMSVGKATIYSRTGAGPEVIEDGVSGLLCDPENPKELAEEIAGLINSTPRCQNLGTAAMARSAALFGRANWAERNDGYYRRAIPAE